MNLEWIKKHPYVVAAVLVGGIVFLYVLAKKGSSGSGLGAAIAQQNAGQLQMAQLNAQLNAQTSQTNASLAASENNTQAQLQAQQDQLAGQLVGTLVPAQLNSQLYQQELAYQFQHNQSLLPLEQQAIQESTQGNRAQTGQNLLALLLGYNSTGLPVQGAGTTSPTSFSISPSGFGFNLGQGLFG